jgi:hypothetical protein
MVKKDQHIFQDYWAQIEQKEENKLNRKKLEIFAA